MTRRLFSVQQGAAFLGDATDRALCGSVARDSEPRRGSGKRARLLGYLLGVTIALGAPPALSESGLAEGWKYTAGVYGWLPGIKGETDTGDDFELKLDDILNNLQMIFMGYAGARKDKWSVAADLIYLKLSGGNDATITRPGGEGGSVKVDSNVGLKAWVATLEGGYSLIDTDKHTLDVVGGARYLNLKVNLRLAGERRERTVSKSADVWDGIVGVRGRFDIGKNWFGLYYADVGTGQSDLTWQASAGAGYRFPWGDVVATWRYLRWNFDSGYALDHMSVNGPLVGVAFHF